MSGDIKQTLHDREASPPEGRAFALPLTGTPAQVEWAERIRRQVNGDFDRVAAAFRLVADRQSGRKRADTEAILIILEDKRTEVMAREEAGYFIQEWQETGGRVRQLIFRDARYQAIRARREHVPAIFEPASAKV